MADILNFDPTTDFEILETFDYEEEVQRPEELRFFTLEEQLLDFINKSSRAGQLTRWQNIQLKEERDRYRKIYLDSISFTDEAGKYTVIPKRTSIHVNWITPIYSDFKYEPYSFVDNWVPIMDKSQIKTPNFYTNRLLPALPRPYKSTESKGARISETTHLVNEEGQKDIKVLGRYVRTKQVIHEDGSYEIVKVPILNTDDDILVKGYYLNKREVEIPNPLSGHPFLSSIEPSKIITDDRLVDIFPTMTAIMNHAIPTTTDPYKEGQKYLKIYDVKLKDIPWNLWKERFPPVDTIESTPPILSIKFPNKSDTIAPADILQKNYIIPWYEGMAPRLWLMKQEDGGALVSKIWLSKVGDAGNVVPQAPGDKLEPKFEKIYPDECLVSDTFDLFLQSGIYRAPTWAEVNKAIDKDLQLPKGMCLTSDYVQYERSAIVSLDRIAWRETTGSEIIEEHLKLLKRFQKPVTKELEVKYEKYNARPESELRRDVLTILEDPQRVSEDKAEAIQTLVNTIMPMENLYLDKDGSFIVCAHTLAYLRGDLENDRLAYYEEWTDVEDGFRVCKFCSEQINKDVLVAQTAFDEFGNPIITYGEISETPDFTGESNMVSSIADLKKLFKLKENAGETTLYLIISLLQVLPEELILLPIIQTIRKLSDAVRANKKIEPTKRERVEGVLGLAGAIVLLQTHNPFLIPRSTYGVKNFKLVGYPRDTDDTEDSPILDNLIYLLKVVFEANPSTFGGSATAFLREVINRPKEVRKEVIKFIQGVFAVEYKTQLETARERYLSTANEVIITPNSIELPIIHLEKTEYKPNQRFGEEELMMKCNVPRPHSTLASKVPPKIVQDPIPIYKNIYPSEYAEYIEPKYKIIQTMQLTDKEVRKNLDLGLSKFIKSEKIERFLNSKDTDGISILLFMNRVLDILSLQNISKDILLSFRERSVYLETETNKSLLRDVTKGLLYELFHELSKEKNKDVLSKNLADAISRDITMNMLLLTKEEADKITESAKTSEREKFKQRMRSMNDDEREVTKLLLDIGLAPYIITNADREMFAKEFNLPDPEEEYNELIAQIDEQRPEEGYDATRDYVENGDMPVGTDGQELQVDYGDYGDRAVRDYDDYAYPSGIIDVNESYGI